jgi:hypothetical protein
MIVSGQLRGKARMMARDRSFIHASERPQPSYLIRAEYGLDTCSQVPSPRASHTEDSCQKEFETVRAFKS